MLFSDLRRDVCLSKLSALTSPHSNMIAAGNPRLTSPPPRLTNTQVQSRRNDSRRKHPHQLRPSGRPTLPPDLQLRNPLRTARPTSLRSKARLYTTRWSSSFRCLLHLRRLGRATTIPAIPEQSKWQLRRLEGHECRSKQCERTESAEARLQR